VLHERNIIGWDLGGAHLKVAWLDGAGSLQRVEQKATPLWQGLDPLKAALDELAESMPLQDADHYLTMTGELVDLFPDRKQGVVELANFMAAQLPPGRLRVFAGSIGFVRAVDAVRVHNNIASANWYATAAWVARQERHALLLDIGSTTADILLMKRNWLEHRGYNDRQRMTTDELVYSGVVRTPVMAVVQRVPFKGEWQGLAAEQFATMADVYRILGWLPEDADLHPSADGQAKDLHSSMRRLARMLGTDLDDGDEQAWRALARYIADAHLEGYAQAVHRQVSRGIPDDAPLIGAGVGRFLAERLAERFGRSYLDIDSLIGWDGQEGLSPSVCAPAVAVAQLGIREVLACAS